MRKLGFFLCLGGLFVGYTSPCYALLGAQGWTHIDRGCEAQFQGDRSAQECGESGKMESRDQFCGDMADRISRAHPDTKKEDAKSRCMKNAQCCQAVTS